MDWWTQEAYRPKVADDEQIVFSEHGRIAFKIDYRSHWFVLVKNQFSNYELLVAHGGGNERIQMPTVNFKHTVAAMESLDSDTRYLMLHHLYDVHRRAAQKGEEKTAQEYKAAFVEDRLKKRRYPARGIVKVWIEPPVVASVQL